MELSEKFCQFKFKILLKRDTVIIRRYVIQKKKIKSALWNCKLYFIKIENLPKK